jgi:hypothetical protein
MTKEAFLMQRITWILFVGLSVASVIHGCWCTWPPLARYSWRVVPNSTRDVRFERRESRFQRAHRQLAMVRQRHRTTNKTSRPDMITMWAFFIRILQPPKLFAVRSLGSSGLLSSGPFLSEGRLAIPRRILLPNVCVHRSNVHHELPLPAVQC